MAHDDWFKRHPVYTGFIIAFVLIALISAFLLQEELASEETIIAEPLTEDDTTLQPTELCKIEQESPAQKPIDLGDFKVIYIPITNSDYEKYELFFKANQIFETPTQFLNDILILPKDIPVVLTECGLPDASYDPISGQIQMCYELIDFISETFNLDELSDDEYIAAIANAATFIFYHESGHALIDILDLPITGREEDAVDHWATVILTEGGAAEVALDSAIFFFLNAKNTALKDLVFWDEHSLDNQRFFDIICLVYGSNSQAYTSLVADGTLPEVRAKRCSYEYQQTSTSWDRITDPYTKES